MWMRQMRDTPYAKELARTQVNDCRIERLWVKKLGQVEIRFSQWPNGRLTTRPLDVPEHELLELLRGALEAGVFSNGFVGNLLSILQETRKSAPLGADRNRRLDIPTAGP